MTQKKIEFKNVGRGRVDLADGRVREPGATVRLTPTEQQLPHNRQLIEDGVLIETEHAKKTPTQKESD